MVRETRHLWVGNLPDNIREDRIREHFKRYGRVQSVKLLPRSVKEEATGEGATACTVAFMDIKSAAKAHVTEHKIDDRTLTTEYYEPAAIPSAASPQNTTSSYSTSPGTTRFPNGHGSTDDHGNFSERFYDRNTNRVPDGAEYIRRTSGYHENSRGRNRDRGYRNGPYNNLMDRSHRINSGSSWTAYDTTTRYNNQNSDTGYSTAPSENSDRRTEQSTKKKTKSRSGSRSPSPSGSTSSRSPSRSRSRSSSSSSSSSTSRATSSTSSPKSRRITTGNQYQSAVHSEDRRPLAICVRNLPCRSSDTSLKDGLFHEYKKHGKVTWVKVVGQSSERHAIVCFKKPEDVEKALEVSYDKLFFGSKIEVAPYQGHELDDNDSRLFEAEIDEFHPKATRTLFIGNLEKDVTASDLRKEFDQFGEIIEIDIKKQGVVSSYAFCQYSDIVSVVKAIRTLDGEHLGNNRIKLGFGKSMPTSCVWVDGVSESVSEKYLKMQFEAFGTVPQVSIDREKGQALVFYDQVVNAQAAVNKMRGVSMKGRKIQVDFASRECQEAFYDHLEKQGHPADRMSSYEERRDSTSRTFDTVTATTRFSRYDTPTRPRTSSYSSRSSATASQCNASAIPSPGTPGSATPRGTGSRSRLSRYTTEYYDQNSEYPEQRHFRNYDEYSQGSAASHEDAYEHEYVYHESPSHLETLERLQTAPDHPTSFPQPDIRNLQKERVHLLEQLEEYPSSGDELISPKKKIKLDHLDGAIISDVIIEANRDHRKVMEVRRLSDNTNIKHHSRRPSVDGKYRDVTHDRSSYLPHAVCKRRKTGGSDNGSRVHHYDQSGSESIGGSRPGTPLCDERPEHIPTEPRRTPRDREGPLSLPLPRFAAQVLHKGSISVAGIKGQKDNILSSPPTAATSPRISNPRPPSPVHVPPPASPPPRPPSLSSTSSDSDIAPPSPSLDERIRSLDEKYEKWSGSRALSAAGGDALLKLDANREKFKFRHKLLDLDLKEVQPSEIVKSVMAKRSVFDEDSKRLENVGEKYEPRDFNLFPKTPATVQTTVPAASSLATSASMLKVSTTQLPKTPTILSPRSTSTGITPAKGLQYPFPTHPPPLVVVTTTTPMTTTVITLSSTISTALPSGTTSMTSSCGIVSISTVTMTTTITSPSQSTTMVPSSSCSTSSLPSSSSTSSSSSSSTGTASSAIRANHGDNRLKPCVGSVPTTVNNNNNNSTSDNNNRTSSKVSSVNRSVTNNNNNNNNSSAVGSSCQKISDTKNTNNSNIINNNIPLSITTTDITSAQDTSVVVTKTSKSGRESKTSSSTSEKASSKRDINNGGSDTKSRRNSETSMRRHETESDKHYGGESNCDSVEAQRREEREKLEKERLEAEKLRIERERIEKEERERQEKERLEKERLERQEKMERDRIEKERLEKERQERLKKEREERERREKEERERKEREEREERERRERKEREERERREKEREERERKEREREERERREKEERERREREEEKRERREREEREERERREKEEAERIEREKRKEEESKHKEDNHEKRKDDHSRHRDLHIDNRHTNHDATKSDGKNTKEDKKDELTPSKKDHDNRFHENRESKSRHHDRDTEKRKEAVKENRENNSYDKLKSNEIRESKDRPSLETRHLSIELDKTRHSDAIIKSDPSKRKERNNSLPVNIGNKRRISCHETPEGLEEPKKLKISQDHKKITERRNSKDVSNRDEKIKSKHKSSVNSSKHDDKSGRTDKHNNSSHEEKRKEREEKHKSKQKDKQKNKSKNRDKESPSTPNTSGKDVAKDFLSRLAVSDPDITKRKESKEKKKQDSENEERRTDDTKKPDDFKNKEKFPSAERNKREELSKSSEERKSQKKDRLRKITNSSDNTDSDEPKKHSIFDIVDDEPAYISMYDKVKARSCKNMQKQEEEKRQEKIKAKFSQLKQSRAKREEKKRSTSWDEDSDSDKECKTRKGNKMLIRSSDEEDNTRKTQRKKDIYYDTDSERNQIHKQCSNIDSSDDDHIKNSSLQRRGSKSRIASDTSDDEFKITTKHEITSDNEDQQSMYEFGESLFKKIKEEPEESKYIKKEKKNSKHQAIKIFGDASSADEITERKEKSEVRKKHKKKQKKQKNSISSEDSSKIDSLGDSNQNETYEKIKNLEKKKQHSKKDKKRDKSKDEMKEKSKKSKKTKSESKRDGKMENIFGSLSDDSENGSKDQISNDHKQHFHMVCANDENIQPIYASDSDGVTPSLNSNKETYKSEEKERNLKEEHRKRKEKKRREKEKQRKREEINENSIDFIDLGKQLEENIKDDSNEGVLDVKLEPGEIKIEHIDDTLMFSDFGDLTEIKKEERKESREKKKKRKKNKEEKQRHHHYHHHHDKNKIKSPEFKKEVTRLPSPVPLSSTPTNIEIKVEMEKQSQSLPNILDIPSPPQNKPSPNLDMSISPITREPMISPIPKTPTSSKEKKREKFIPGFGSEIDEKIHESAVKSISEFEQPKKETNEIHTEDVIKDEKPENNDEKPRVVISQEETEDAVAALLGESFGSGQFEDCYNEQQLSPMNSDQVTNISDENNVQDDEEMRQAVRSLNSTVLDMKPDTPQSEHELQIDTDTEEQEEISLRYDQPPKTPDTIDLSQPPKTPDIPSYYRNEEQQQPQKTTIVIKTTGIGSPPSLTPIKQEPKNVLLRPPLPGSLPSLPEQRSVISKPWVEEKKEETSDLSHEIVKKVEEPVPPLTIQTSQLSSVAKVPNSPRPFTSIPTLKVTETTLTDSNKQMDKLLKSESPKVPTSISLLQTIKTSMHNVPQHIPYPIPAQKPPNDSGIVSSKLTSNINRLPITSVQVVSKPIQSTTLVLPQPKQAQTSEPLKLISTERPRMVYQNTPNLQQFTTNFGPRVMQRCGLPPQGLLLPNKTSYTAMRLSVKGNTVIERPLSEPPRLVPTSPALPPQTFDDQQPAQNFTQIRGQQQNFAHINQQIQQTVQVSQAPFASLPLPFQAPPSIIVSAHSTIGKSIVTDTTVTAVSTIDTKTFTPVIQEAPKLISNVSKPEVRSPQPAIIQQAPPKPTTPVQQNVDLPTKSENMETLKTDTLKTENVRTSTPSPVIISNLPMTLDTSQTALPQEPPNPPVIEEEEPQLAIEKVTEELNLTLEKEGIQKMETPEKPKEETAEVATSDMKEDTVKTEEIKGEPDVKTDPSIQKDIEKETSEPSKLESEGISVIKEIEKIDEEKADTDSVVSDISKERLSAEILSKDDPLDSKEDSDYWSAKEVNIESVIKTVDALCSADDLSDRSSEIGKDDWFEENKIQSAKTDEKVDTHSEVLDKKEAENDTNSVTNDSSYYDGIENIEEKEVVSRGNGRRGGRARGGRKNRNVARVGVQTRRAKVKESAISKRGGRGGRSKNERKSTKSDSEACADVYEFRDDSDDTKDRPRLILTIKQQAPNSANGNAQQTAIVKEVMKLSLPPTPPKVVETKEEFTSPVSNTRKSKRLQEKDISRNTVDDTIEDVIKNTAVVTRSATAMAQNQNGPRRSTRQAATKPVTETPRKSPRGGSKKKDRRASETTDDSSEEKATKSESVKNEASPQPPSTKEEPPVETKEVVREAVVEEVKEKPKEKPHEGLKATVLRRVKGEMNQEPMTLIDPVTGLLTPMRECEEGKYIPISGSQSIAHAIVTTSSPVISQASVVTPSFQKTPEPDPAATSPVVVKVSKPQSLKAHVLSSQAAKAVVSQQMQPLKPVTSQSLPQSTFTPNSVSQNLNINISSSIPAYVPPHLSPRPVQTKAVHSVKIVPSQLSPNQQMTILQKPPQQQNKVINPVIQSTVVNTQMAHIKQPPVVKQPTMMKQPPTVVKQQQITKHQPQQPLVLNKTGMMVKHTLHQQPVIGVAGRVVQTTVASKAGVDPPKVEVSMAGCVMVPRSNVSPQNQPRHVLQAGMPVPAYEASLGEAMGAHFPPGSVPLRPPHDLSTTHYLHGPHVVYQQLLRQLIPRSPMVSIEKSGDGQEGEEAPVTSPPLELRRPGSVGLALSGRSNAVPHSLQSPHDRTTDSPQVYGMPSARVQHYHPGTGGRYYEQEPPPAHRPVTSHGSLAALGSERPLSHMGPLGTPDRPLSAHSAVSHLGSLGTPERSISTHLPERPLSGHGLALGAGLGAAGNLMGAVARHVGADAPASQRGIQAATPPHASQVPPQAESLLMLLKQYPCMWQGLLALKNDQAAVQMYFVSGNDAVAKYSLPKNSDGSTPPLRIFQRMRLEPPQVEGVARKMQMENEHCMLLALPCGHDHMDVLKQSTNLNSGFITYLQQKQAAGIVNVAAPGTTQPPAYVVHIFPSCDFVNENLRRIAPSLLERVADIAHLLIVITTV